MRTTRPHPFPLRSAPSAWFVGAIVLAALLGLRRVGDDPPRSTAHADTPATGRLVTLGGAQLVGAGGSTPVDALSFWTWRSGWEPILWQHEKRAASGSDDPIAPDPSVLEGGDRIVLALDDLGTRWPGVGWPEGIAEGTWPIEIAMRSDGSMPTSGSVYLFEAPVPPAAASLPPRIRWDEASGRVVSEHWSVGLKRSALGGLFVDHVSLAGDEHDLLEGWARMSYPDDVVPPPPTFAEGVVATPIISGPLRAVFPGENRDEVVVVGDRRAMLRTTAGHPIGRDDRRQHLVLSLSAGPGARWRDDRRLADPSGIAPMGAGQPWPAWWELSTPAGRLVGLTDPIAPCLESELAVSIQDVESGLSVRLDARSPGGEHRFRSWWHWTDLPHELVVLPAGEDPAPEQVLDASAFPVHIRILGTQPDAPAPTPTATRTPDSPFDVTFSGHVRDATRTDRPPLAGFRVAAIHCGRYCEAPVRTDETGAFTIVCPEAGPFGQIELRAWRADAGEWRVNPFTWGTRRLDDIEVLVEWNRIVLPVARK